MYSNLPIGSNNPGLIVILIDQSGSMAESYAGTTKQQFATLAANRCIYDIITSCRAGEVIKDRCHIGVIGYGKTTEVLVGGRPQELDREIKRKENFKRKVPDGAGGLVEVDQQLPIWIDPQADNGTPMDAGFELASQLIQAWTGENPNNFPPVVINVTDGIPNDPDAAVMAAQRLISLGTSDGTVLLLNAHISDDGQAEVKLPGDANSLPNDYARLLFRISSVLPAPMLAAAQNAGFAPGPNARGFVMNANAETLTKLIVFGSAHAR